MKRKLNIGICIFSLLFIVSCSARHHNSRTRNFTASSKSAFDKSIIRVQVSSQSYSFVRPWEKKPTRNRNGFGVVVKKGLVLVTAKLVADSTYIELQKNDGGPKSTARIRQVDYKANLALLEPEERSFLDDLKPIPVRKKLSISEKVGVLFGGKDGKYERQSGRVHRIEMEFYPFLSKLLLTRVKTDLPAKTDASSLPIIKNGRLCGFGMSYNQKSATLKSISLPVIRHFMDDFVDGKYEGFPLLGIDSSSLDDEQLRDYLKLKKRPNGIYVYRVRPGSPAKKAGLLAGDVLLYIDGLKISRFGRYEDPHLGATHISHYISCGKFSGEKIILHILRDGMEKKLEVKLETMGFTDFPVPSYLESRPPQYLILGGLVLTELSRQYLQEWGPQWRLKAPENLVHYYLNQWDMLRPGQRLVLLSHVLPTKAMIGYTKFSNMIIHSVNDKNINRIEDVVSALKESTGDRFHHLQFVKDGKEVYIDRSTIEQENSFIRKLYGIFPLQRLSKE